MSTIEEMQQELLENGYEPFSLLDEKKLTLKYPYKPDFMLWEDGLFFHSINQTYAHYLQQKEHAEMKTILEDILKTWENYDLPNNADIDLYNAALAAQFARTAIRAKAILAEKETS